MIAPAADGATSPLGRTDERGLLRFVPAAAGSHHLEAVHGGVRLVAPIRIEARQPRWLYALACGPLGIVLLFGNWRRRARRAE